MRRLSFIAALLTALFAAGPVLAQAWNDSATDVSDGEHTYYEFTGSTDSSALHVGRVAAIVYGFDQDVVGTDTDADAAIVTCPLPSTAVSSCITAVDLTADSSGHLLTPAHEWIKIRVDTPPTTGTARVSIAGTETVSGTVLPVAVSGEVVKSDGVGGWASGDPVETVSDIAIVAGENENLETDSDGNWQVSGLGTRKDYSADERLAYHWKLDGGDVGACLAADDKCCDSGSTTTDLAFTAGGGGAGPSFSVPSTPPPGAPVSLSVFTMIHDYDNCWITDDAAIDTFLAGPFTAVVWVRQTAMGANDQRFIWDATGSGNDGIQMRYGSGTINSAELQVNLQDGDERVAGVDSAVWHQIVGKYNDGADASINYPTTRLSHTYIDGVLSCSGACATGGAPAANAAAFVLGSDTPWAPGAGMTGEMSHVMFFDALLTDREICELYAYGPDGTWTNGEASCFTEETNPRIVGIGPTAPSTCSVGDVWVDTNDNDTNCTTSAANVLCICTADDTWTEAAN